MALPRFGCEMNNFSAALLRELVCSNAIRYFRCSIFIIILTPAHTFRYMLMFINIVIIFIFIIITDDFQAGFFINI